MTESSKVTNVDTLGLWNTRNNKKKFALQVNFYYVGHIWKLKIPESPATYIPLIPKNAIFKSKPTYYDGVILPDTVAVKCLPWQQL